MRLIINADDLGVSEEVNDAILSLMAKGMVTSATALANGPALDSALRGARSLPLCSFGVHLNLTQFCPLTKSDGLNAFLSDKGEFTHRPLRFLSLSAIDAAGEEWCAQVARIKSLGIEPSHLDSHHHVHLHPSMFVPLIRAQRAHNVRKVRRGKNIGSRLFKGDRTRFPEPAVQLQREIWRAGVGLAGNATTTHGFTSLMEFYDLHRQGEFDAPLWAQTRKDWVIELMVHPGHPSYAEETRILESGWLDEIGVPRVSYKEI